MAGKKETSYRTACWLCSWGLSTNHCHSWGVYLSSFYIVLWSFLVPHNVYIFLANNPERCIFTDSSFMDEDLRLRHMEPQKSKWELHSIFALWTIVSSGPHLKVFSQLWQKWLDTQQLQLLPFMPELYIMSGQKSVQVRRSVKAKKITPEEDVGWIQIQDNIPFSLEMLLRFALLLAMNFSRFQSQSSKWRRLSCQILLWTEW